MESMESIFVMLSKIEMSGDSTLLVTNPISNSELNALYAIYNATNGQSWTYFSGNPWNFSEIYPDPCGDKWQGLTCSTLCNTTACSQVIAIIDLDNMNLVGTLPVEIGDFSQLVALTISNNVRLAGTLPDSLGNLSSLLLLDFTNNLLSGTLPTTLGQLNLLADLTIMSSSLRGKPPQEIYTLTSLHTLTLTNSYFTGSIPLAIVNLTNLEELTLSGCQFTGNVPEEMNQLTSLISIDLTNNYLTGTLSPWLLTNLTNLQSFIIYGNRISGPIPNITTKSSLTLIDMGYNRLTGTLPVSISLGQYLTGVFLEENDLTGTIPPEWGSLSLLWDLYLNDNALRGNIPSTLQNLQNLKILSLSNNINIIGTIPMGLGNITGLQHLLLSDCSLTGSLPSGLGSQKYLYELDVGLNYLTGSIPSQLYQTSHLSSLSLHNNLLTGTLSTQCVTWLALNYLILDNNIMHGSIPSILTNFSSLFRLSLGNNLFSGSFNVDLTSVIAIGMLQLEMNQFTGDVSLFMSTKENIMEYFNITTNYFSGDLSRLSLMTSLAVADFSQNLISGTLPAIYHFPLCANLFGQSNLLQGPLSSLWEGLNIAVYLRSIDFSNNRLEGSLPTTINSLLFPSLLSFASMENCLTGTIPDSFCNITRLQVLALDGLSTAKSCRNTLIPWIPQVHSYTLHSHSMHGTIPKCLFSMRYLQTLHLSSNGLDNQIPIEDESELGPMLTDVSLSHNRLTGNIPGPLKGGKRWQALDLSYNKLEGTLTPTTTTNDDNDDNDDDDNEFNSTSSIYLNINRLSGRIPGFYYDISSPGDLNMLRGNLFTCPTMNLKSHLPQSDPYHTEYDCGSDSLNTALLIWLGLISFVVGLLYLIYTMFRRSTSTTQSDSNSSELPSSSSTIISSCGSVVKGSRPWKRLQEWMRDLLYWQEGNEERWKMEVSNTAVSHRQSDLDKCNTQTEEGTMISMTTNQASQQERKIVSTRHDASLYLSSQFKAGVLLHDIRLMTFWIVLYSVSLGSLVFGLLTHYYGSYEEEYAWTISAAYLTGTTAAIVLFIYFIGILCLQGSLLLYYQKKLIVLFSASNSSLLDDNRGNNGSNNGSNTVNNPCHIIKESQTTTTSPSLTSITSIPPHSNNTDDSNDNDDDTEGGWSTFQEEEQENNEKLDWKVILCLKVMIAVVDIVIVLLVNGFYVYISLELKRWSAVMLSVALSFFKVIWSLIIQTWLTKYLQPLQHLPCEGGLHENNVVFMSGLMLFNTIIAPCLAAMIASSDCFYYVFASPSEIVASYSFNRCVKFLPLGCAEFDLATYSTSFAPPFTYTYQCSSAILVDYAYVFAYKYVLIGVLYPLLIATIICFEGRTEEEEEKNVSKHGERLIDWRRLLPTLWKRSARSVASTTGSNQPQDSGSLSSSSQGGIVFFSAAEYAIRLVMMLSCLLTFGVTIPYLAILIGFSIVSNTYLVQLGWLYQWKHRMLTAGQQVNDSSSFTQLCKQCGRLFHCMRLALPPMIFFLPLFFAYFLFDTAGDKGGWVMGLCFALSLVAVCILVSCSLVFILWHWTSWMRTVTMSHEDSKKNEVCEAEEGPPCVAPPAPSEEESKTQSVSQDSTNIELASTSLVSSSLVNDDSAFVTNAMHHRSC